MALLQIVDTTLLKCYLATNPALVSNLLRLPDNYCNFEESERSLRKARRYDELIILYKNKKFHKKGELHFRAFDCPRGGTDVRDTLRMFRLLLVVALEFLKKEMENPESTLNGHLRMARYLVEIAKDELDMVFQYARYVIKASLEEGLQVGLNLSVGSRFVCWEAVPKVTMPKLMMLLMISHV